MRKGIFPDTLAPLPDAGFGDMGSCFTIVRWPEASDPAWDGWECKLGIINIDRLVCQSSESQYGKGYHFFFIEVELSMHPDCVIPIKGAHDRSAG